MISIPLTAAVFLSDPPTAPPYGKLEDGNIVTNTGYPDFYFPEMVLDRGETYNFTITIESGSHIAWAWAGNDADIYDGYSAPYAAFGYRLFNAYSPQLHPYTSTATTFEFSITPDRWTGIPAGNNTPFFETDANATVTAIEWDGPDLWGGGGVSYEEEVMADSPALFLKFDGSTPFLAVDSAGGGHDFELHDFGPAYHAITTGEASLVPSEPANGAYGFGTVGSTSQYGFLHHPDTTPSGTWGQSLSETVEFTLMLPTGTAAAGGGQGHYLFNRSYYTDLTSQSLGFVFQMVGAEEGSFANAGYFYVNATWAEYNPGDYELVNEFDVYGWGRTLSLDTPHLIQITKDAVANVMNVYVDGTEVILGTITALELEIVEYNDLNPGSASPVELFYPDADPPEDDPLYQVTWQIGGLAGVQLDDLSWYPEVLSPARLAAHVAAWGDGTEPEEPPVTYPSTKLSTRTVFAA